MMRFGFRGFTLIEILLVMAILGFLLSITVPVSYEMYKSYKAELQAEEVMVFVSGLKRESFLYNEMNILSAENGVMKVNGQDRNTGETRIEVDAPIEFYKNGTTSGGTLTLRVQDQVYVLRVQGPMGNLFLERKGQGRS